MTRVPRFEVGVSSCRFNLDPEAGWASRVVVVSWGAEEWVWFKYDHDYYDGEHRSLTIGRINIYWNW